MCVWSDSLQDILWGREKEEVEGDGNVTDGRLVTEVWSKGKTAIQLLLKCSDREKYKFAFAEAEIIFLMPRPLGVLPV